VLKRGSESDGRLDASSDFWSKAEARLGCGADHRAIIKWLETLTVEVPEKVDGPPNQSA
jgi:hypothetical protein